MDRNCEPMDKNRIRGVDGVFPIRNINAYDSRLKTWIRRYHGVAAKYLDTISDGACLRLIRLEFP